MGEAPRLMNSAYIVLDIASVIRYFHRLYNRFAISFGKNYSTIGNELECIDEKENRNNS